MSTSYQRTIYRKCECGETAFDAKFRTEANAPGGGWWTWQCRNCGRPALDRSGSVRTMSEHDRPGSSEGGPG